MVSQSARAMLTSLIDYAGLFPPAKLDMGAAVENFARYTRSEHEWMLGRFICPVSQLEAFSQAAGPLLPGTFATSGYREYATGEPWRISAIIDGNLNANLEVIEEFNAHHADEQNGQARIDMIELKVSDVSAIDVAIDNIPVNLHPFFEFPIHSDPRGFIAALAGNQSAAKIRTGGITPDAFPTSEQVAAFMVACVAASVPFKATAGLHHICRGENKLTYESDSRSTTMHGFLNVFVAAAAAMARRADPALVCAILNEQDRAAFRFSEEGVQVRDLRIDTMNLARVRESFALSFGSCSFEEPVAELTSVGIL